MTDVLLHSMFRVLMYLLWRVHDAAEGEAQVEAMGYINRLDDDYMSYRHNA